MLLIICGDVELNPGPTMLENFLCTTCGKTFSIETDLQKHIMQVHDDRTFNCDLCPTTFLGKKGQQNHTKNHQLMQCSLCQSDFETGSFYQHKKTCGIDATHIRT